MIINLVPTGGVVPNLAMEAHKAAIDRVVDGALAQAGLDASQLDGIAVTVGPGLSLCLRVSQIDQQSCTDTLSLCLRVREPE